LSISAYVISVTIAVIAAIGYPGIFLLMMLEGMLLPIPSEVVMLFGGYLVATGGLSGAVGIPAVLILLAAGTAGNVTGALVAYMIGKFGGLRLLVRYGRYIMIDEKSIQRADRFFSKYGGRSVFTTRLIPIFRTFISIPAGIAEMNIGTFTMYTALGTTIWNILLVYIGMTLGKNWNVVLPYFEYFTYIAAALILVAFLLWLRSALRRRTTSRLGKLSGVRDDR
jgi:membrane protein DedA with SNARE-associated domain